MINSIPSWARVGAKVVLIDASAGDVDGPHNAVVGDICIIDFVTIVHGIPACICHEENGRWHLPELTYARLSRFRPLVGRSQEQKDVAAFRNLLNQTPVDA